MAVSTLRAWRSDARAISGPVAALASGDPTGSAVLALDLGQKTGSAERTAAAAIADQTQWHVIPDWPDYEVSEWGDVRRLTPTHRHRAGMVLAPFYRRNGYAQIVLQANHRRRRFLVHRLVAMTFLEAQPSPAHEIAHINGNRAHNHFTNLRWVLHRENEDHKQQHGTRQRGSRIGTARLNEEQVRVIKRELRAGKTQTELAARFNVHPSTVSLIARRQFWRHELIVYEEVRAHRGTDACQVWGGFQATLTAWCEQPRHPIRGRAGWHHQTPRNRQGQRR
jgi:hypothetical protein